MIGLTLTDGTQVHADLVVFSIGITPRDELARAVGLDIGPRGGITIGDHCSSSIPGIGRSARSRA